LKGDDVRICPLVVTFAGGLLPVREVAFAKKRLVDVVLIFATARALELIADNVRTCPLVVAFVVGLLPVGDVVFANKGLVEDVLMFPVAKASCPDTDDPSVAGMPLSVMEAAGVAICERDSTSTELVTHAVVEMFEDCCEDSTEVFRLSPTEEMAAVCSALDRLVAAALELASKREVL